MRKVIGTIIIAISVIAWVLFAYWPVMYYNSILSATFLPKPPREVHIMISVLVFFGGMISIGYGYEIGWPERSQSNI